MAKKHKHPKFAKDPIAAKAALYAHPPSFHGAVLAWRFNAVDRGGPFAWSNLTDPAHYKAAVEKLAGFEVMSEADLSAAGCHAIPLEHLSKAAQHRLIELELDDLDALYSFRLTGKARVFGVARHHYLRVLWYDPDHLVCSSHKKHT
ncbi:hypothetical protein [Ruegeria jejuensis]|uniref:hypothetical protein n=1 Tax=Ruegeria jejuensis TaxID=3233338 RepID=UPI00355B5D47